MDLLHELRFRLAEMEERLETIEEVLEGMVELGLTLETAVELLVERRVITRQQLTRGVILATRAEKDRIVPYAQEQLRGVQEGLFDRELEALEESEMARA